MDERRPRPGEPTTVRPPFDPVEFARESDSRIRVQSAPASGRPTSPPPPDATRPRGQEIPLLAMAREDLEWFDLDAPALALLRLVNGEDPVEVLCASAGLSPDEAFATLERLARENIIAWR
jgi:hypothetical protein